MIRNGFTLVELLVVIALMSAVAGVVVMASGSARDHARQDATRFATRLAAARDEAILTGQPVSAWVSASGYEFLRFRQGRWERMSAKPFEGADWARGSDIASHDGSTRARVRFDSLGLPDAPLSLRIASADSSAQIVVSATGDVRVD